MSKLLELLQADSTPRDLSLLFKNVLHKAPYYLKYSLDKNRPDLVMFHATPLSETSNPIVQECNGIILKKDDYSIVAYGLNNFQELSHVDQVRELASELEPDGSENPVCTCTQSEDGSVLKVFYYADNQEWIVSTSKRIDASRVKWSSEHTFYELLSKHLQDYLEPNETISDLFEKSLDKNYTYSFILVCPENYHIIKYPKSQLFYVSRRNNESFQEDFGNFKNCPGYLDLEWLSKLETVDLYETCDLENRSALDNALENSQKRGLVLQKGNLRYKYDYIWFKFAEKLRYNMPNLRLSYLACDYNERIEFRKLFGNDPIYDHIDEMIKSIINYTFQVYRESYIRKMYLIPKEHPLLFITSKVHNLYKSRNVPITLYDVYLIMNTIPAYTLDSLIAFFSNYGFVTPVVSHQQE